MKGYLIDGLTALILTDIPKPTLSKDLEIWKAHRDGYKRYPLSEKLQSQFEAQGKKDWDEITEYKDFRLIAIHPSETEAD